MNDLVYIDRPPRIQPELPSGEIDIPKPQAPPRQPGGRLVQIALPLVSIIGYVLIASLSSTGRNPLLLIPMALSVVASMGFSLYSYRRERQLQRESERSYAAQLIELNKGMQTSHDLQRRFYRYNYPDHLTNLAIVREARRATQPTKPSGDLRSVARLWERRADDNDFGVLRLGVGTLPSTVVYTMGEADTDTSPQSRAALKLAADSQYVSETPVIIALRQIAERDSVGNPADQSPLQQLPGAHALGIAGNKNAVYAFVRALLEHYVVFHAPDDARLYLLASERREWDWAERLPHCSGDTPSRQLCFVSEIEDMAGDPAFADDEGSELEQYLEGVRKTLAQRRIRLQERENGDKGDSGVEPRRPFLLVVVDLLDAAYDTHAPLHSIETDSATALLLEQGAMLGAAIIFLVPERSKVPSACQAVIEVERTAPAFNSPSTQERQLHFRYIETGVNSVRYVGEADAIESTADLARLAHDISNLRIRQSAGANLATAVPFLELMGYRTLDELIAAAWQRWQESSSWKKANWLRVKLGLMVGNKPRTMVFSAKRDGVHGMVAGSTGSGKSELLISLISGMAVTYDPSVLNFVLVDYKGGGAFKEFADLPHCVDIITNLAADGVTRMFTAINAEMKRRQALNAETRTKDIVEYRKKNLHVDREPYPYLFIIIDEFAEMIADRAEYKTELESITRVGRAQGVSLILAAQRPSGVTDQMRSNIKFRICLRVETPVESREMLRRTDAAFLPPGLPGRGYLQVGNEEIEQIQVAYTGDPYIDPRASAIKVIWPDRGGGLDGAQDQAPPEMYKAIIERLKLLAEEEHRPVQRAPWPKSLPDKLFLSETLVSTERNVRAVTSRDYLDDHDLLRITMGQPPPATLSLTPAINRWLNGGVGWIEPHDWLTYVMRPVIGLIDNPYSACQHPLTIDLPRGHCIVFGASGSGKTVFLRSLVLSLATTFSPDHLHCYILDLGGRNLSVLSKLPHVGAVVIPDEEGYQERVGQILREIDDIIEQRKRLISTARVTTIYEYNQANPTKPEPAIVVVIDNMVEFIETFGAGEANVETVLSRFIGLARQCRAYGVHIAASTGKLGDLSNQLFSLFTERFALRLTDSSDYRAILGAGVAEFGDIPGRGYTKVAQRALGFQVARPIDLRRSESTEVGNEIEEIEGLIDRINIYLQTTDRRYARPVRIDALPKAVLLREILARSADNRLPLDAQFMPRLKQLMEQWWSASTDKDHSDWLQVLIGVASGNRPRTLNLEAKEDGVHGIIAGGTGAGKSELLMTMIVSLALRYDPSALNFVLVDYKGGGAFAPFKELPHVVESVTNLNKSAVKRMFTAISAEMQRRQQLNTETDTKDIVEYRTNNKHVEHAPYPFLFIIIDEYAEMISANPEFGIELDSIARVGRAQGVHLLLAAQRPTGVSDQMRANIKLRICLRVEQPDTSRELLRRSDAAFLPNGMPGRGYIQAGAESIELIQVAFTGESDKHAPPKENGEQPRLYELVVEAAKNLHEKINKQTRPRPPWPSSLPTQLFLGAALDMAYLRPDAQALILQRYHQRLELNPFAQDWIEGRGDWRGIDWNAFALRAIAGLIDDPGQARQLPLTIDFTKGHAVIFGASGWGKTTLLRTMVLSLAATHSPAELHVHALDMGGRGLDPLAALPQVGTLIMPDERGYEERVQQLWRDLGDIIDRRKQQFSAVQASTLYEYNRGGPEQIEPAILVLIDNIGELIETFGADTRTGDEGNLLDAFVGLARQGKPYGLHFAITAQRLNVLSGKLFSLFTERLSLRLANADEYSAIVGAHVPEVDEIAGRGYVRSGREALTFQVALAPDRRDKSLQLQNELRQIQQIGEAMQARLKALPPLERLPLRIGALPKSVLYRQMLANSLKLNVDAPSFLAELKATVAALWEETASDQDHADWLRVPLGMGSGGRTRTLTLEAKVDGVHGMVAGGTGSGKSELLMTLIVSLALRYAPETLNFVLVDYKGGGAFTPFEGLPHCVDIVTNLYPAAVARMFTAISAEMQRRQRLNRETDTKDIVEYRAKNKHIEHAPYPFLFIIIDEYAEMIDANDEFRQQLDSITRVGRAQGVHLLLASQQPKGVSDQMRANIKLRICLRVEQPDTSRELLRRPDAALLPNGVPGRGYLQVGNDTIELIQVAWTGEPQPDKRPAAALWPDRPQLPRPSDDGEVPRFFDAAVMLARELRGGHMAPKPWPAFLPSPFTLESAIADAQRGTSFRLLPLLADWLNGETTALWSDSEHWLRPVLGLFDNPARAEQQPLRVDLARSHLAIFGDAGMGKTTLLRTLLVSLAATHNPDALHVYVLDLGGRSFSILERAQLPHLAAVLYADEDTFEERFQRLLNYLSFTIEERQRTLGESGAGNVAEYNARNMHRPLPAVVVLIDNIAELSESYRQLLEDRLIPLVRRGLSAGVSFVVTANVPTSMPSKLYTLFGERLTFKQTNTDRYMDIVGRGAMEMGDAPGRGYLRRDGRALLFQAALPIGLYDQDGHALGEEAEELKLLSTHMQAVFVERGRRTPVPTTIGILEPYVGLDTLLAEVGQAPQRRVETVIGRGENLQPAQIDLKQRGPHLAIFGPPLSGKTTALATWALSLATRYSPTRVMFVLIDTQGRLFESGGTDARTLADLPHTVAVVTETGQLKKVVTQLKEECAALAPGNDRGIFVLIDNFDDFAEEMVNEREAMADLAALARRYGRYGLHLLMAGMPETGGIDLKKRILAANFGLGLRTAAAVNVLGVQRTPTAVNGRELPVGRGYLVKAGQPTQIQIASPYDPPTHSASDEEDDAQHLRHISRWVQTVQDRYPGQHAAWAAASDEMPADEATSAEGEPQSVTVQMATLVARALDQEQVQLMDGNDETLTTQFARLDPTKTTAAEELRQLLREIYVKLSVARGNGTLAQLMLSTITDDQALINSVEGELHEAAASRMNGLLQRARSFAPELFTTSNGINEPIAVQFERLTPEQRSEIVHVRQFLRAVCERLGEARGDIELLRIVRADSGDDRALIDSADRALVAMAMVSAIEQALAVAQSLPTDVASSGEPIAARFGLLSSAQRVDPAQLRELLHALVLHLAAARGADAQVAEMLDERHDDQALIDAAQAEVQQRTAARMNELITGILRNKPEWAAVQYNNKDTIGTLFDRLKSAQRADPGTLNGLLRGLYLQHGEASGASEKVREALNTVSNHQALIALIETEIEL